jgi:hypothetical protein
MDAWSILDHLQLSDFLAQRSGCASRFLHEKPSKLLPRKSILGHSPDDAMVFLP